MNKDIGGVPICMATLFEKIISGEVPSHHVASGEGWYAFLDIFPRREGHTLVIPTAPRQRLSELTQAERHRLMDGVANVQNLLTRRFGTSDFTVCLHDGPLAGQEVPHVHIHVLPRTEGDGGGTLMSMWPHHPASEPDHETLRALAASLQDVV